MVAQPTTRVRFGKHDDLAAITRLIQRANAVDRAPRIATQELETITDHNRLLVLPGQNDEVAAAACVAPGRGLVFLVIDPDVKDPELEDRMIGVADALCESEHPRGRIRGRR
jgi:hypothetical protein